MADNNRNAMISEESRLECQARLSRTPPAALAREFTNARFGALGYRVHLLDSRRGQYGEAQLTTARSTHVYAIERERMEVEIETQRAVKALHEGDRAGVRAGDGSQTKLALGPLLLAALQVARPGSEQSPT